jgi:hypothetical protein
MRKTSLALSAILLLCIVVGAQVSSRVRFQSKAAVPTSKGSERIAQIMIQRWTLDDVGEGSQTIPISAFSVMSLRSGRVETTINGKTEERSPDDFWVARPGDRVQVRVIGENAVLEALEIKR